MMMDRSIQAVAALAIVVAPAVTGCAHSGVVAQGRPAAPGESFGEVEVVEISPPDGSGLARGQEVEVTARVRYDLQAADRGSVTLVVQDQRGRSLLRPQPEAVVKRGPGEVTLKGAFKVPHDASGVDVLFPLGAYHSGSTRSVAAVHYGVE